MLTLKVGIYVETDGVEEAPGLLNQDLKLPLWENEQGS
jgi:hypothetical protein